MKHLSVLFIRKESVSYKIRVLYHEDYTVGIRGMKSLYHQDYTVGLRPMWHETFIVDKLIPHYDWGDQPPDCKGADVNVSILLVASENHQTSVIIQNVSFPTISYTEHFSEH